MTDSEKIKPSPDDFRVAEQPQYRHLSDAEKYRIAQAAAVLRCYVPDKGEERLGRSPC